MRQQSLTATMAIADLYKGQSAYTSIDALKRVSGEIHLDLHASIDNRRGGLMGLEVKRQTDGTYTINLSKSYHLPVGWQPSPTLPFQHVVPVKYTGRKL